MNLAGTSVAELARRCREETGKFVRGEPRDDGYCFELFARAIERRDSPAWDAIVTQYRGMVIAAIKQHSATAMLGETEDFWVNRTFQRFWLALSRDRFGHFNGLPSLLKYLKMCAHSVLMDEVRARRGGQLASLEDLPPGAGQTVDAEGEALGALSGVELWQVVRRVLTEESEWLVAYLSLARDLKPAEIQLRHQDRFATVAEVYRVKRNVLDRLRRSAELRAFMLS